MVRRLQSKLWHGISRGVWRGPPFLECLMNTYLVKNPHMANQALPERGQTITGIELSEHQGWTYWCGI